MKRRNDGDGYLQTRDSSAEGEYGPGMAKLRPSDAFFWVLATLALALFAFFLLVLSGVVGADPPTGSTQTTRRAMPAQTAPTAPFTPPKAEPEGKPTTNAKTTPAAPPRKPKPAQLATVVLTASRGDCWFQARAGSATGRVLEERVLSRGESISIKGESIWLTFGAAGNLDVTVDGKSQPLSSGTISVVLGGKSSKTS